jgi:hypothetical protein
MTTVYFCLRMPDESTLLYNEINFIKSKRFKKISTREYKYILNHTYDSPITYDDIYCKSKSKKAETWVPTHPHIPEKVKRISFFNRFFNTKKELYVLV